MLFTSLEFFLFLPLVLAAFAALPVRWRWAGLLLASWVFYGGLEEVLTGWVLGQLPDSEEDVDLAERTAIEIALGGLGV